MVHWSTLSIKPLSEHNVMTEDMTDRRAGRASLMDHLSDHAPKYVRAEVTDVGTIVYAQFSNMGYFGAMGVLRNTLPLWTEASIITASNTSELGEGWYIAVNKYDLNVSDFFHFKEVEDEHGKSMGRVAAKKVETYSDLPTKVAVSTP